jgi:hypothetical protein
MKRFFKRLLNDGGSMIARTADGGRRTADGGRQTADGSRRTADRGCYYVPEGVAVDPCGEWVGHSNLL